MNYLKLDTFPVTNFPVFYSDTLAGTPKYDVRPLNSPYYLDQYPSPGQVTLLRLPPSTAYPTPAKTTETKPIYGGGYIIDHDLI